MGLLEDILKTLDRFPLWKRVQELPSEVDDLKRRISEIEEKLAGKWPADVCRHCGARAARIGHTTFDQGFVIERWDCAECRHLDFRRVKPR